MSARKKVEFYLRSALYSLEIGEYVLMESFIGQALRRLPELREEGPPLKKAKRKSILPWLRRRER
jgi:hypothetical protein